MPGKLTISIVGPGRLGTALARALHQAGYPLQELVTRASPERRVRALAKRLGARAVRLSDAALTADLVWLCVPDGAISTVALSLARATRWNGKIVLHSSGALSSDQLAALRRRGAAAASLHPMMSFVYSSVPQMLGVWFAVEGDRAAVAVARRLVADLGGELFTIRKPDKVLYHALGAFASPLIIANLSLAESVARAVGLTPAKARKVLAPILRRTLENYLEHGAAAAFSGPIVRGDIETVRQHLRALQKVPPAREAYMVLARAALRNLPVGRRQEMRQLFARTAAGRGS